MASTLLHEPPSVSPARAGRLRSAAGLAALVVVWLEVCLHLHNEWNINPQYSYGWSIPLLAAFLFYRRWTDRPAAEQPIAPLATLAVIALLAAPLLPARIISIANPDWRLLSWALGCCAAGISFALINLIGGRPWMRHFAFPILFMLVGVPWPANLEQRIVLGLMQADAAIVLQVLNAIGTIAIQRGNVIELSTGVVGIDDACTGVRSLQSTLMIALLLGEYYRMSAGRRVVLVGAALAFAFFCNVVRTLILCLLAADRGVESIDRWHDSAGFTILLVCLAGLWFLSSWLAPKETPLAQAAPGHPRGGGMQAPAIALACWIFAVEVAAASWYHVRSAGQPEPPPWAATWPTGEKEFRQMEVPAAARELLRYDEGGGAKWNTEDGRAWFMFYFRWLPGHTAALFVKNHRPDICLPASGLTMREQAPLRVLSIKGIQLPFRSYRFEGHGQYLDVFYCYWDARSSYSDDATALKEDWSARGRLETAWHGRRETGARMVQVGVWGYDDPAEANAALTRKLDDLIVRQ
jgi:exosortase